MISVVFEILGSLIPGFPFKIGIQMIANELVMICHPLELDQVAWMGPINAHNGRSEILLGVILGNEISENGFASIGIQFGIGRVQIGISGIGCGSNRRCIFVPMLANAQFI